MSKEKRRVAIIVLILTVFTAGVVRWIYKSSQEEEAPAVTEVFFSEEDQQLGKEFISSALPGLGTFGADMSQINESNVAQITYFIGEDLFDDVYESRKENYFTYRDPWIHSSSNLYLSDAEMEGWSETHEKQHLFHTNLSVTSVKAPSEGYLVGQIEDGIASGTFTVEAATTSGWVSKRYHDADDGWRDRFERTVNHAFRVELIGKIEDGRITEWKIGSVTDPGLLPYLSPYVEKTNAYTIINMDNVSQVDSIQGVTITEGFQPGEE